MEWIQRIFYFSSSLSKYQKPRSIMHFLLHEMLLLYHCESLCVSVGVCVTVCVWLCEWLSESVSVCEWEGVCVWVSLSLCVCECVFLPVCVSDSGAYWRKHFHRVRTTSGAPLYINFNSPPPFLWFPQRKWYTSCKSRLEFMFSLHRSGVQEFLTYVNILNPIF